MSFVSVIIPAYNEEERIKSTILSLKQISYIKEIIVVDDGSCDKTSDVAKSCGAKVIKNDKNIGKGDSLNKGIKHASYNIILTIDADLQETAKEAEKLILPVIENRADITIAKFKKPKIKGGFGIVQGLSRWGIKKLTGYTMQSPLSGQRCFKKEVYEKTGRIMSGFGAETSFTIDAARHGFKILEVETEMKHRETGRSIKDFLHRGKQLLAVIKVLTKNFLKR